MEKPLEQLRAVHQAMDYNCSIYHFPDYTPPNVTAHFEAFGILGMSIAIGGTASTLLLIVLFGLNCCFNITRSPSTFRRLLGWITSMPMVISLLALATFLVPRAGNICDIVKQSYMPFLMMHFIDLAVLIEGGESGVLATLEREDTPLTLCTPPCCCFGICACTLPFTKKRFRILKSLVYQAPLFQFILTVTSVILEIADLRQIIPVSTAEAIFQAIALLNIIVFSFGNWGFNILIKAFKGPLKSPWNLSIRKSSALSIFISILKLQNFILGVVDYTSNIPCIPPDVSTHTMKKSIDAALSLIEALIFGIVFYFVFKIRRKDKEIHDKANGDDSLLVQPMSRYWTISNPSTSEL